MYTGRGYLFVLLLLLLGVSMVNAAIFTPTTVADLINDTNTANSNNSDDTIDLGGHLFILNSINNVTDGNNGLPVILSDNSHSLLITGGTIERDPTAVGFRFFRIDTLANLTLSDVALLRGLANNDDPIQFPGNGGGALLNLGSLTIEHGTIVGNISSSASVFGDAGGGAIYNFGGTIISISGSYFLDNKSASKFGGAIQNNFDSTFVICGSILEISQSTFDGNSSGGNGGAIANFCNMNVIQDNIFWDNTASGGGALYNGIGSSINTLINSTFYGNTAIGGTLFSADGGAIAMDASSTINNIENSTFSSNAAYADGGAIFNFAGTIVNLVSTIVAGDIAPANPDISNAGGGVITNASFNLIGTDQGHSIVNGVDNNQVGTLVGPLDPLLSPPSDNGGLTFTCALFPSSPAINAGSNPDALLFDQRGYGYFRSIGQTDIGAFELQVCP